MATKSVRGWIALGLIGAAVPATWAEAQDASPQAVVPKFRIVTTQGPQQYYELAAQRLAPAPLSEYWLGIALDELPDVAKTQLGIEHGVVVDDVLPDSPASQAGIKKHDVLKSANGKGLHSAEDIMQAVDESKGAEIELVLLRGGKELTIKVKPVKRPEASEEPLTTETAPAPRDGINVEIGKLEEAIRSLRARVGNDPLGLWFAKPGWLVETAEPAAFPKNLKVQIKKEGPEPAQVHVEYNDKHWDITEDRLGELPEDIRSHVQSMLGKAAHLKLRLPTTVAPPPTAKKPGQAVPAPPAVPQVAPPLAAPRYAPQAAPSDPAVARLRAYRVDTKDEALEAKLDQILKKLDQMENKALEALQNDVKQLRKDLDELRSK